MRRMLIGVAGLIVSIAVAGCGGAGSPAASSSGSSSAGASATSSRATTSTTTTSAAAAPSTDVGTSTSGGHSSPCRNATVSAAIKRAIVVADGRPYATEVPGDTFYGTCGTVAYAVTRMRPRAGAPQTASVPFQDQGAYPELLTSRDGHWRLVARATQPSGCTQSSLLPRALRALWHDCAVHTSAPAPPAATTCADRRKQPFVHLTAVRLEPDGSARLTGTPMTVHCGGPDDSRFVPEPGTVTVDLRAGGTVRVVKLPGPRLEAINVRKLPAYVASGATTDVFLITGTFDGLVYDASAVTEQYHP